MLVLLRSYLENIVELQYSKEEFYRVNKFINILNFFVSLSKHAFSIFHYEFTNTTGKPPLETARKIGEACQYITRHSNEDLHLDTVAAYLGFSPSYFSRTFKQLTGRNFIEYLLYERVKKARTLLFDFDLPITEIAYSSGFKSISTFNRVFHKYNGYSPSEYRKYMV